MGTPHAQKITKKNALTAAANLTAIALVRSTASRLPDALIEASSGMRTTASEPVSDDGVKSSGITIPLALPNSAVASAVVKPHSETSSAGSISELSVPIALPVSLAAVSGAAEASTLRAPWGREAFAPDAK